MFTSYNNRILVSLFIFFNAIIFNTVNLIVLLNGWYYSKIIIRNGTLLFIILLSRLLWQIRGLFINSLIKDNQN